jgi:hypothetical protein
VPDAAADDAAELEALDALADALALDAELDADELPHAARPRTAAQHRAKHARARALADFDIPFPCFMKPSSNRFVSFRYSLFCIIPIHNNTYSSFRMVSFPNNLLLSQTKIPGKT